MIGTEHAPQHLPSGGDGDRRRAVRERGGQFTGRRQEILRFMKASNQAGPMGFLAYLVLRTATLTLRKQPVPPPPKGFKWA